ncbi:pentapeptide repeat-containing protein, partial [Helicobacter pullorum]
YDFIEITFNTCIFQDNVYFNNSIFEDYADFHECEFEKTANFYGAKFEKAPNFSQVQFKGSLNAVNMDLDFGFESLREKIKAEYELSKQQAAPRAGKVLELQFHKSLASIANDFRDSFRIFKNALIKENNNLDASEFHKLELYCKEIELGESPNKRGIQAQSEEDVRKNTKPFKESIDWFLLRFYRKLSEHHTDLLRVLNNLVLLIALYAGFVYIGNFKIGDAKTSSISQQLFQHIEAFQNYIKNLSVVQEYSLVLIILLILFVAFAIYLVFKLKLLIHIKTTFKIILAGIMKDFWLLLKILSVILSIFCIITFIVLQFETNNRSSILVNIFGFCLFIILYLWLVCLDSIFLRYIVVIVAYIVASVALGDNIAILNPLLGKLISDKEPINDPLFTAITLAYTILTLLVLFSLQKTARKNSIVPS